MRVGFRTKTVKCPDGTKHTVYRRVDDAFPLHLGESNLGGGLTLQDLAGNKVELSAELERGVAGLVYQLSKLNESVMLVFRTVYVAYQADPCGNSKMFSRKVDEMTSEIQRLTQIRLELESLITLASAHPGEPKRIWREFSRIVTKNNLPGAPQAGQRQIRSTARAARQWIDK